MAGELAFFELGVADVEKARAFYQACSAGASSRDQVADLSSGRRTSPAGSMVTTRVRRHMCSSKSTTWTRQFRWFASWAARSTTQMSKVSKTLSLALAGSRSVSTTKDHASAYTSHPGRSDRAVPPTHGGE